LIGQKLTQFIQPESLKMLRRVCFVVGFLITSAAQAQDFPYSRDLVLDARPMRGGKRVPVLSVEPGGAAQIDLWCKRGQGQAVIAGDTITIIVQNMADEACTPERAQADEQLILALSQTTTWSFRGDVVMLNGGTPLRFRAAAN
jgi:heat shock protein HslJ